MFLLCCGVILQFTSSFFPTDYGIVGNLTWSCPGLREQERAVVITHSDKSQCINVSYATPPPQTEGRGSPVDLRLGKTKTRTQTVQSQNPDHASDPGRYI